MALVADIRLSDNDGGDGRSESCRRSSQVPQGLRRDYRVHAIGCGVPPNMLSKWIGHASREVTAIHQRPGGRAAQHRRANVGLTL